MLQETLMQSLRNDLNDENFEQTNDKNDIQDIGKIYVQKLRVLLQSIYL